LEKLRHETVKTIFVFHWNPDFENVDSPTNLERNGPGMEETTKFCKKIDTRNRIQASNPIITHQNAKGGVLNCDKNSKCDFNLPKTPTGSNYDSTKPKSSKPNLTIDTKHLIIESQKNPIKWKKYTPTPQFWESQYLNDFKQQEALK
jgi:hypothetical protein